MRPFNLILGNTLIQNVTNFTVWFALVFWAFVETRSVFVTGIVGGIYMVSTAGLAVWFGNVVDHHSKKRVMLVSSAASLIFYSLANATLLMSPETGIAQEANWTLWLFIMLGLTFNDYLLLVEEWLKANPRLLV